MLIDNCMAPPDHHRLDRNATTMKTAAGMLPRACCDLARYVLCDYRTRAHAHLLSDNSPATNSRTARGKEVSIPRIFHLCKIKFYQLNNYFPRSSRNTKEAEGWRRTSKEEVRKTRFSVIIVFFLARMLAILIDAITHYV